MSVDRLDFVTKCKRVAKQALGEYAGEPARSDLRKVWILPQRGYSDTPQSERRQPGRWGTRCSISISYADHSSPALAHTYLEETFEITYSREHCRRLLHEAGLSVQTARPIHYEADPDAQRRWREEFKKKVAATES